MSEYPAWVIPTTATRCARNGAPGGHAEDRPTVPGTDLCGPCHGRLPRVLADLVSYWRPLHDAVVRRPGPNYTREQVDTSEIRDAAASWNPAATATIVAVEDWARYMTRTVLRECRVPQNEVINQDSDGTTWAVYRHKISEELPVDVQLATLAKWYGRWISHYPTLGPAWLTDLMALRFRAMQAVDPNAPTFKRVIIRGRICTDELTDTEWGPIICGAQLVGLLRTGDSDKPSTIVCSADPNHTRLDRKDWILAHPA